MCVENVPGFLLTSWSPCTAHLGVLKIVAEWRVYCKHRNLARCIWHIVTTDVLCARTPCNSIALAKSSNYVVIFCFSLSSKKIRHEGQKNVRWTRNVSEKKSGLRRVIVTIHACNTCFDSLLRKLQWCSPSCFSSPARLSPKTTSFVGLRVFFK